MSESLDTSMRLLSAQTVDSRLLNAMEAGIASQEAWAEYVRERIRNVDKDESSESFSIFETFLSGAIACSRKLGYESLTLAFEKNFREELGQDNDGKAHPEEVHKLWRTRFRTRMQEVLQGRGVAEEEFLKPINPATLAYNELLEEFGSQLSEGSLFEAAGAMCALEGIIRDEYARVLKGLLISFPEVTKVDRRYIEDHAEHDDRHYRWIRAALDDILGKMDEPERAQTLALINRGAKRIANAKKSFFREIENNQQLQK